MIRGIGIELVEVAPYQSLVERGSRGELEKDFTDRELDYSFRHRNGGENLAARRAAKKAAIKAMGLSGMDDCDGRLIEILRSSSGQPTLQLHGAVKEAAAGAGIRGLHVSMSHSGGYAVGLVVAETVIGQESKDDESQVE